MDRTELQVLSRIRVREAKALMTLGMHDGAYYLGGYAVECALKARIAKGTRRHEFPERKKVEASHTHNLRELVSLAKLDEARIEKSKTDPKFRNSWDVVQLWSEQSRYRTHGSENARALIEAIENKTHGVLAWIRQYW